MLLYHCIPILFSELSNTRASNVLTLDEVIPGSYKIRHLPIILMIFTGRQTNFEWMDISGRSENGLVNQAGLWRFLF